MNLTGVRDVALVMKPSPTPQPVAGPPPARGVAAMCAGVGATMDRPAVEWRPMETPASARRDDKALAARLVDRERSAPAALYDAYARVVLAMAVRVTGDRALAEDVVQEVFVVACTKPHLYDAERGSLLSWLLAITRNRAVDRIRVEERQRAAADAGRHEAVVESAPADEEVLDRDDARRVRAALDGVPPRQREVIELMYFSGLEQRVIAQRLDVPVGTVKSRAFHGLQRLRDLLSEPQGSAR